jgi:hypothetical protein
MADLNGNEEELNLLRQENQTLRDQANLQQKTIRVQEETIGLLREQIGLKDQLIATLQWETMLLTKQMLNYTMFREIFQILFGVYDFDTNKR